MTTCSASPPSLCILSAQHTVTSRITIQSTRKTYSFVSSRNNILVGISLSQQHLNDQNATLARERCQMDNSLSRKDGSPTHNAHRFVRRQATTRFHVMWSTVFSTLFSSDVGVSDWRRSSQVSASAHCSGVRALRRRTRCSADVSAQKQASVLRSWCRCSEAGAGVSDVPLSVRGHVENAGRCAVAAVVLRQGLAREAVCATLAAESGGLDAHGNLLGAKLTPLWGPLELATCRLHGRHHRLRVVHRCCLLVDRHLLPQVCSLGRVTTADRG